MLPYSPPARVATHPMRNPASFPGAETLQRALRGPSHRDRPRPSRARSARRWNANASGKHPPKPSWRLEVLIE
jgi:hypothetical protein